MTTSSTTPDPAELELRESLLKDLQRQLDRDVHISGYIVAFVARRMPLELVERLVDELDQVYPPNGTDR